MNKGEEGREGGHTTASTIHSTIASKLHYKIKGKKGKEKIEKKRKQEDDIEKMKNTKQ